MSESAIVFALIDDQERVCLSSRELISDLKHSLPFVIYQSRGLRCCPQRAANKGVPGPGLTNALTGMGMAHSESAPMLVFGGQNALAQLDREGGHFHELANSVGVAASVCGYAIRVAIRRASAARRRR